MVLILDIFGLVECQCVPTEMESDRDDFEEIEKIAQDFVVESVSKVMEIIHARGPSMPVSMRTRPFNSACA